jgi:hypothetical protein
LRVAAVDKRHQDGFLHEFVDLGNCRVQLLWWGREIAGFEVEYGVSDFRRQIDFS